MRGLNNWSKAIQPVGGRAALPASRALHPVQAAMLVSVSAGQALTWKVQVAHKWNWVLRQICGSLNWYWVHGMEDGMAEHISKPWRRGACSADRASASEALLCTWNIYWMPVPASLCPSQSTRPWGEKDRYYTITQTNKVHIGTVKEISMMVL